MASALAEVGFEDGPKILAAYPFQLSGGMLQRVMLAMALSLDPALLIADEPTSDLDTVAQARVLDLIDAARRGRNMGVLLVTHDFGVAARMARSIVVMDGGRVVETGEAGAIFAAPVHESARALVAAHEKLCAPLAAEGWGYDGPSFGKRRPPLLPQGRHFQEGRAPPRLKGATWISGREGRGLVGRSGCGKSTLGRILLGLGVPTRAPCF